MCLIKDVCCKNKHAKIKTKTGNIGRNKGENEKIQAKREKLKKNDLCISQGQYSNILASTWLTASP